MNTEDLPFFLCVEDDSANQKVMMLLMEKFLHTQNYAIFENGINFVERVRGLPVIPSIILLDIQLPPPHDGFDLLRIIREYPAYASTKIVALTASVMNEEIQRLQISGFDGAIGKPIVLSTFQATIHRILKGEVIWQV
jgi:two-component system sensor histidine kinase BarA